MENIKRGRKHKKMGNSVPLARSKGSRPTRRIKDMLLASGRDSISICTSSRRNKRKASAKANRKTKDRAAEDITTTCSVSAEAQRADGDTARKSKSRRYRKNDKNRQPDTRAKGKDRTPRRSASELGIEWIGSLCPDGQPHFLVSKHTFDGGSLFKCNNCHKSIWLPTYIKDATELEFLIKYQGTQDGYCKFLDKNRSAKVVVAKLQELWYARQKITDNDEFMNLVIKVMEEKDYDRVRDN